MKNILIILIILFGFFGNVFAQEQMSQDELQGVRSLDTIKEQVVILLKENLQLETKHSLLEKEYYNLYEQVDSLRKAIDSMVEYSWKAVEKRKDKLKKKASLEEQFGSLQKKAELKKNKTVFLKGLMLDSDDSKRLWNLRISQLDYRLKELKLEAEMKQKIFDQKKQKYDTRVKKLNQGIADVTESNQQEERQVAELEKKISKAPENIRELKGQMKEQRKVFGELQIEKKILVKKNSIWKDKQKVIQISLDTDVVRKQEKRDSLETIVKNLRRDYENLDKKLRESLRAQKDMKKLLDKIKQMDMENQKLRNQVAQARKQLEDM